MRNTLFVAIAIAVCGAAHADAPADTVTFIPLQTPDVLLTKISGNGAYAVGSTPEGAAGFRWSASTGSEEVLMDMNVSLGINNFGTIAGAVAEGGGSDNGGHDLGAYALVGSAPVLLSSPLHTNSNGFDIADDGTVVGLSFDDSFSQAIAFAWNATDGMSALPVLRMDTYSRANAISADGRVIVGWNDDENGGRPGIIWLDRVPMELTDPTGFAVGEASGVSSNGQFVVGSEYMDKDGNWGSWRWSAETGVQMIPMGNAFGVSDDGKTVLGTNDFFTDPPRAAMIWREGIGTMSLAAYLAEQGVTLPADIDPDLAGGFGGISGDGTLLGGYTVNSTAYQSYLVRIVHDRIMADGFDGPSAP